MRRLAAAVALTTVALAGCAAPPPGHPVSVGAGPGSESALLAHLYAAALGYFGTATHITVVPDPVVALDSAAVTVAPGFTGDLLARFAPHPVARSDEQVYRSMISALPEGVGAGDYTASAQDKPAVAVTAATADRWGGRDVAALPAHCIGLTVGVVAGARHPARVGDCGLPAAREFPDVATLFAALRTGEVTLAWTSTAAPEVPKDLVVLTDKTALIRAENIVPLYRRNELTEQQVLALNGIAGELDTATLTDMLDQVNRGADPAVVAGAWLAQHPLDH
ncbi:glycine betaine ABC transporter substrate-binding protein [Mycobacterium sp. OTB74]|jgi:glycine betaine/choline ABC-type transport system substrate-binding protein|uniref:glycine betaine ABC transporter substrate-binding protein n=1 Tax=Mycobacterium sp. OTB74 TaxID=1853452 RepID=UPI0024758B19|nr:glycine betaine ABC transporter substrate-binding protein [Mycobacterium sp. OTB74]MDH6244549.1 osmoprotectant transport system substrate-binding protein [Mycobacterium sp. OTB74]